MRAIDARTLIDGSQTTVTIYEVEDGYIVEAVNREGTSSMHVENEAEAWHTWLHPFDREARLTYPSSDTAREARRRPLSDREYALLEAIEAAEGKEVEQA